jgi:quinolinate synthase
MIADAVATDILTGYSLEQEIRRLKAEMNAIILAHYYQESEIQDIADFVGDSLELSRAAMETTADVIVFAGVHFMAETAKILNPDKRVLLPDLDAGCSLAESAPAYLFRRFREMHPHHLAVTYINCTAEVKALSDIICTSSSAERIVSLIPPEIPILFAPDRNLGRYLMLRLGREFLLWQGTCMVHEQFSGRKIHALCAASPNALLIAHPECEEILLGQAEFVGSTSALLRFVQNSPASEFIVATEPGILHQMRKTCPDKHFIAAPPESSCACNVCPYMKLNTLEKLHACMRAGAPEIRLPSDLAQRARASIDRMLLLSRCGDEDARRVIDSIELPFRGERNGRMSA